MYGGLPGKKPWLVRDQAPLLKCAMKDQENELKLMIHDTKLSASTVAELSVFGYSYGYWLQRKC